MDLVCLIPFPAKDSTTWLGEHPPYNLSFCSLRWFGDLKVWLQWLGPYLPALLNEVNLSERQLDLGWQKLAKESSTHSKGSLGTVRNDNGSQPMGVGGPPCWVPSSRDQSQPRYTDSLPVAMRLSKSAEPCFSVGVLTSLARSFGPDEWPKINIHSFHLLRPSCLVSPKSSRAACRREQWWDKSSRLLENGYSSRPG